MYQQGINLAKWIENSLIRRATKPLDTILERIKNFIGNVKHQIWDLGKVCGTCVLLDLVKRKT